MAVENDLVLIYFEDTPLSYARIEEISADAKPDWYHVKLLFLQVPLQMVTWILRDAYIDGEEFTMNGKRMRLEKVVAPTDEAVAEAPPSPPEPPAKDTAPADKSDGKATVIAFNTRKKK